MFSNLVALALFAAGLASAQRDCSTVTVPPCQVLVDRDLMFLVDSSDSLDPAHFQTDMLDYTQSLYCAFSQANTNRAGMITFSADIIVRIPLQAYTPTQWFNAVETVRSQSVCCSCCTPTATAFQLTKQVFDGIPIGDAYRIVFVITDGAPWQNTNGPFAWPSIPSATYTWGTVPQQSLALKQMSDDPSRVRVMMVGVPDKFGTPPRTDYFMGVPDATKVPAGKKSPWQQQSRGGVTTSYQMLNPPFPIVSVPVDKNTFSSTTTNVQDLINLTVGSLCEILPTPSPTTGPTTKAPTNAPTKAPTTGPTKPPTPAPTNAPTFAPTNAPTKAPTKPPTGSPTSSPSKPSLSGLDMFLLLDRSRSMTWVPALCRAAPGGNPQDADNVACWRLFLTFVNQIVEKTLQIPYQSTTLGWMGNGQPINRGLRLWVYAFACSGHQKDPITITLGERITNAADFATTMATAATMIPDGGTCPGEAIDGIVAQVQGNDLLTRIYKTALIVTDGVFYDMPRPKLAELGLFHFGVLTYSLGIAIPTEGQDWGLKPYEIVRQRNQLLDFVQKDQTRLFNFGLEGLNLLPQIADELVNQLPYDAIKHLQDNTNTPYWCGYTSQARCTNLVPDTIATGKYCQWNPTTKKCFPKAWCGYTTKTTCLGDSYCKWTNGVCAVKPGVPGG